MAIYTVGHSRHTTERFIELLRTHAIDQLVDVRSQPVSKWVPHFDKAPFAELLGAHAVLYNYLGHELGGRPRLRTLYRDDGSVDYARLADTSDFKVGIQRLIEIAKERRTTILCAEEDPTRCHRRLLVAPALSRFGIDVVHIRGDGRLESEVAAPALTASQLDLFGGSS